MQQLRLMMREEITAAVEPINRRLDSVEKRLDSLEKRMDSVEEQLDEIKENTTITREAVNTLCEWAEQVGGVTSVHFPLQKAE